MILTWNRIFVFALATLLLSQPPARGDYWYTDSPTGGVSVTTYPNSDLLGGLQPGQARILFDGQWHSSGAQAAFLDTVAFNTDLTFSPSQITVPAGWTLTPNAVIPGFGRFSWALHTSNPQMNDIIVGITIDGLGSNASASHFWLPSMTAGITPAATPATFAFHDAAVDYFQGPDTPWLRVPQGPDMGWNIIDARPPEFALTTATPEPSSWAIAGLGVTGLLAARVFRRRRTLSGDPFLA